MRKTVCSFLNSRGGIIFFGVNDDMQVVGKFMNSKDMDDYKRNFRSKVFEDFDPIITPN